MEYLSSLFDSGRQYRTIALHRSVLSSMFPPLDGFLLGTHPTISRLMKGVFNRRPPSRRLFQSWDVAKVFASFPTSLDFAALQEKTAFLLAMASSRRPSELATLRCDDHFMNIDGAAVRFIPSALSKTDRQTHLGPAIRILRLPASDDSSPCPVATLEALLQKRRELDIGHDFLFSSASSPHVPISVSGFSALLKSSFRRAGISAPPGSTRSISVSDAFARGASIDQVLLAGDWSAHQTFFRHYLRPSASVAGQ